MGKKILALKYKYRNAPVALKATFWFMFSSIIQKGIQFLVTPIYTRLLTTEQYGFYSVYLTWQNILMIFATLNLSAGVFNNGMMKYNNDRRRFISSMQGLGGSVTIILFTFIMLFFPFINKAMQLDKIVVIGMFASFLFYPSFEYWTQYHRYQFQYKSVVFFVVLYAISSSLLSVFLIMILPLKKYAVIFSTILTQIIFGVVFFTVNLHKGKKLYVSEYWKFALKFNVPLIPHYLSFIVLGQADRIMINYFCGESAAGIYSLSYTVSLMLNIIVNSITSTYTPWVYQNLEKNNTREIQKVSGILLDILTGLVVLCILVAPELIKFLGTEEYLSAVWIIPPVMLSCYFTMLYSMFANIEFYKEKSICVMIASVLAAVSNIILNYIFIPKFGFIAAGYTTLVSYIFLTILHLLCMLYIIGFQKSKEIYNIKAIVIKSILLIVVSIALNVIMNFILIRYIIILLVISIFIINKSKIKNVISNIKS